MKDTVIFLLCAFALAPVSEVIGSQNARKCNTGSSEAQKICMSENNKNVLVVHRYCNMFYKCSNGKPHPYKCPSTLLYDPVGEICEWPHLVECGDRPHSDSDDSISDDTDCIDDSDDGSDDNNDSDSDNDNVGDTCNCNPGEAPSICAAESSNGVLVAHENCNQFYMCSQGVPVALFCPGDLLYNPYTKQCDYSKNVVCGDRLIPEPDEDNNEGNQNSDEDNSFVGGGNCDPSQAPTICGVNGSDGVLVAHKNCNQYYMCSGGLPVALFCPPNLLFNPHTDQCDWAANVDCGDREIPDNDDSNDNDSEIDDNLANDSDNGGNDVSGSGNCDPSQAPSICAASGSDGVLVAHENCHQFYECSNGKPIALMCPNDLLFNPNIDRCDWPKNVDCGDRVIPDPEEDNNNSDDENDDNSIIGGGNCDPSQAPSICAAPGSDGVLVAHENCNQFYECSNGKPIALKCPNDLLFNPNIDRCDWPKNVDCGDRVISDPEENNNDSSDENDDNSIIGGGNCDPSQAPSICAAPGSDGVLVAHENCNQFYECSNGKPIALKCPNDLLFNPNIDRCDWPKNVDCGDRVIPDPEEDNDDSDDKNDDNSIIGGGNCDPSQAPSICAAPGSDGVLVAHENCNQFYKCFNGKPVALKCPYNLLFNPNIDQCDWPENVDCGDRVILELDNDGNLDNDSDNDIDDNLSNDSDGDNDDNLVNDGGNDVTCNCNPGEAPTICSGINSDGILVAHENCNQFYKCDHGKPVVFTCPPNTFYNPYREECDWASNVDCGDRAIPDTNDPNDNGNDSDNSDSDDNNNSNDNNGTCNCNPGEAPSICSGIDSDGILVAHENCNQFYKCDHGKPVVFTCPPNTLYNPYREECDWASNVDCGDRLIPDPDNDGDLDNDSDNDVDDNLDNDSNGDIDDNLVNDGENGGTCNCNPGEAPTICAGIDSDGILVAHENCNQFYKCDHGKPVVFTCPPNTLYNPYREECDWVSNVDCGDRVIPDTNDPNDNVGDDNDNSDSDDNNSSNDNNGTCNCNPGEALAICSGIDSDGILVAHENCKQFYKCDHGKPVVFTCPPNTLYNPYREECDWASNVDCGDRLIPDPDSDGDLDNDGDNDVDDNLGNDSDGDIDDNLVNDGENGGTCNCNPGEAPTICSGIDSDGILVAHENCNQFYKCDHGKPVVFTCPPNTLYNPYREECDWVSNVDCGDRVIPDTNDPNDNGGDDNDNSDSDDNNSSNDNNGTCNCNPGEALAICSGIDSDGILVAHENCKQFYKCDHGKPVVFTCPPNTLYNPYREECDWASNVDCGDRLIPDPDSDGDLDNDGDNDVDDNLGNDSDGDIDDNLVNDGENGGTCNCNPGEAPTICSGIDSDGILVAHENCNQFYKCDHGKPVVFTCPPNTLYNPYREECDWVSNVDCGDRVIPDTNDPNDNGGDDNDNSDSDDNNSSNDNNGTCNCNPGEAPAICSGIDSDGILVAHENCNQFYKCDHGKPIVFTCPPNTLYNPYREECDWASNVDCDDRLIPDPDSDGDLDNDGDNDVDDNLGNDSDGDIDDNLVNDGENGGTCNCNPGEAPTICSGIDSDGILVAHENCNQFYKCDHGKPVVFTCPPNTLYNPYREECDWVSNVDCGDRVIPDTNDPNDNGGDDNDNSDSDDNNSSNDNNGTCNCNPGEALTICSGIDSDGILIAHENCNQFYKCEHGKPVVFTCPPNTLYNSHTEKCDWASNVDCSDRLIPDPDNEGDLDNDSDNDVDDNLDNDSNGDIDDNLVNDGENGSTCNCNPGEAPTICSGIDSDGVLIAHENCNQFYKCANGLAVALTCPSNTYYNPYKGECDWESEVDCGDRVIVLPDDNSSSDSNGDDSNNVGNENDTNGIDTDSDNSSSDCDEDTNNDNTETCNCNPEEASSICAAEGSNGILIAHKTCNQFYQCSYGNPVEFTCPGDLMYDPLKEECNWANEVDCGDRLIPEPKDEEDSNNDSNEASVNDPEDIGICNCNPGEAPSICLSDNSDGVLIAHENCNQFYMCSNGLPIALKCPGNTLYNPYQQRCDWASDIECGDRVIPDSEEDNNGNDDYDENSDSEDDNNNTVHDDPSQAIVICTQVGSDGTLVAHENCNQFYQCSGGLPIVLNCTADLLYNPASQQCDWPQNVDCGDRIIPETDEDCSCNPRNAPALCSRENSDGKLIAHENCHQFYICNHGLPVARYCPSTLIYNIAKEVCDWPVNVDCNNRIVVAYSSINKHYESRQTL